MIIDAINLNNLRIFECVFRTLNMTEAASELHLTQSGVSQHIKSLEEVLNIKLFDRVKRKLIPTAAAATLHEQCSPGLLAIEQALVALKGDQHDLSGTVAVGMPIEFGNNLVLPLLSSILDKHPGLRLQVTYGYATEVNRLVMDGTLDFALIDEYGLDRRLHLDWVYDETLVMCASQKYISKHSPVTEGKAFFESLDYISYLKGEPIERMWFSRQLGTKNIQLNVRATVMDVRGIARLVRTGVGVGCLPGHLVAKLENRTGDEAIYKFKGRGKEVVNRIHLAYLEEKSHSLAVKSVRHWLIDGLRTRSKRSATHA